MVKPVEGPVETAPFDLTLADVKKALKRHPQMSALDLFGHLELLFKDVRDETEALAEEVDTVLEVIDADEDDADADASGLLFIDKASSAMTDAILLVETTLIAASFRGPDGAFTSTCPAEIVKMYNDLSERVTTLAIETAEIRQALSGEAPAVSRTEA